MQVEAIYFDVLAGRNRDRVAQQCWKQLGPPPAAAPAAEPSSQREPKTPEQQLDDVRRERCLVALIRLAARDPKSNLGSQVLHYLESCQAAEPDQSRWKRLQYQLLIALDMPQDLEKKLCQWIDAGDPSNAWRLTLGRLQAERGRLAEAIKLFESVRAADELGGPDYRVLAAWYTATDRHEAAEQASFAAFQADDEETVGNWLQEKLEPWQSPDNNAPPRELDADVPRALVAVLAKSSNPEQHIQTLQGFYQATHDFRLLAALADAMIGHTSGEIYPFLQDLNPLLDEVQDEATVDSLFQHIAEVRRRAKTDIDRRALDLLKLLVECRAAAFKDQPGSHAQHAAGRLPAVVAASGPRANRG